MAPDESDTTHDAASLLPCPHCGGPAKCLSRFTDPYPAKPRKHWQAFCETTACTLGITRDTRAEAIAVWNQRTPAVRTLTPAQQREACAELVRDLHDHEDLG